MPWYLILFLLPGGILLLLLALGALVSVGDRLRLPKERRYLLIPVPMEVDDQERGAKFLNRILENIDANGHDEWAGIYRSKTMEVARPGMW